MHQDQQRSMVRSLSFLLSISLLCGKFNLCNETCNSIRDLWSCRQWKRPLGFGKFPPPETKEGRKKGRKEGSSSRQTNWNIYSASACLMDVQSKLQGDPNVNYLQRTVSRYLPTVLQFAILHVCTVVVWELVLLLANYWPDSQRSGKKIDSVPAPATIGRDATTSRMLIWILDMHTVMNAEFLRT